MATGFRVNFPGQMRVSRSLRTLGACFLTIGIGKSLIAWRGVRQDEGLDKGPLTEQLRAWLVTLRGRASPPTVESHGYVDDGAEEADHLIPQGRSTPSSIARPSHFPSHSSAFTAVQTRPRAR